MYTTECLPGASSEKYSGGWGTIGANDANHDDYNLDAANVSANSTEITVPIDTSGVGAGTDANINVISMWCIDDEDLSGAVVTWEKMRIRLQKVGLMDRLRSDGSSFSGPMEFSRISVGTAIRLK